MATTDPARLTIPDASHQLSLFARQMTVMLAAGVPLLYALEVLSEQFDNPTLGLVVSDLARKVASGFKLSAAMASYPRVFSKVFVGLVQAGESTGNLTSSLERLSGMLEKDHQLRQRLKAAFVYPAFVMATTFVLTLFVFYTVLPNFVEIFRSMNVPLPLITRMLIFLTDAVRNPGCWLIAVGLAAMGWLRFRHTMETPAGRLRLYRGLMHVPVAGRIVKYSALTRFCWVMDSVLGSGIDLVLSLRLAAGASGSPELELDADNLVDAIRVGEELSGQFAARPDLYTRLTAQMVLAAEETSDIQKSFERLACWFAQEMDSRVDLLNALIEPILMSVVALVVGTIVIGIFLPLYSFLGAMGS